MSAPFETAWFSGRKFGNGWALHNTWQGWLLIAAYLLGATGGVAWFGDRPALLSGDLVALTVVAILVCWWKGERSRWRGNAANKTTLDVLGCTESALARR